MPRLSREGFTALLLTATALFAGDLRAQSSQTAVSAAALRRIDLETHTPVRVLNRQELARLSHRGLGEALQRLPLIGGSAVNLNSNASGDGSVSADIGGLGRARCVVMLNGHRLPVNELLGVPAVDLEAIPLAAVERVEIFLGGASPAWGADAVAGVINIITRSEADGADLSVSSAMSTRGDAHAHRAALFGGRVFGRGYIDGAVEYRKQDPIDSSARSFSSSAQALGCADGDGCLWPFGSSITPGGLFVVPPPDDALEGGLGRMTADSSGGFRTFVAEGPDNDLYSTQGETFLRAARRGVSVTARAGYEFSERTQGAVDVLMASDRSRRRLAAVPLTTSLSGSLTLAEGDVNVVLPLSVPADNIYNPFGRVVLEARRRLVEAGPRSLVDDTDVAFASGTLRHAMDVWKLEGTASWGKSSVTEHISHVIREELLPLALGSSGRDAAGNIVCGVPDENGIVTEVIADCVPLDVFHGPGSVTPEMLNYITTSREDSARVSQQQLSFIARRDIALGGQDPAQLALGIESRSLTARFDFPGVPLDREDGDPAPTAGTVDQQDLIAEIVLPFRALSEGGVSTLSVGGRLSRFESRSTIGSAFTALSWRLDENVLGRARVTQVYRAPSAGELFLGPRERVLPIGALCSGADAFSLLCGLFGTAVQGSALADAIYLASGNSELRPERGYSLSTGMVWNSPERRERFVSLDATWTRLKDAIRAPGAIEILEGCTDEDNTATCERLVPSALGAAVAIDGSLINGGRDESARLDLEAQDGGATRWGNWRAELFASYLLRRQLTDINGNRLNLRGTFDVTRSATGTAYPTVEGAARLQWQRAPWTADWSMQYIGSYDEVRDRNGWLTSNGGALRSVNAALYHDLSFAWSLRPSWNMRVNIENVFDREPPFVNNGFEANTDAPTYRLEGRLLSASIDISF